MYELKVQNPKDKNMWIQSIRNAVVDCPPDDSKADDNMTADQKQRHIDEKQATIRELIGEFLDWSGCFPLVVFRIPQSSILCLSHSFVILPKPSDCK